MRAALVVLLLASAAALSAHERTRGVIGFVDESGALVFKNGEVHEAGDFAEGLAAARVHKAGVLKLGYLDRKGAFAIEPRFDAASAFSEGLAFVHLRDEHKSGYIDKQGRWAIEAALEDGRAFVEGVAPARQGGKWGFIDRKGAFIVKPAFDDLDALREGRARVKVGEKWGFADRTGALVIPASYSYAAHFSEGLARVRAENGRIAFIDRDGKLAAGPLEGVAEAGDFRDGRSLVRVKTRWGYIDRAGRQVIPAVHEAGTPFSGGSAAIQQSGKWSAVDVEGRTIARLDCEWTLGFQGGHAPFLAGGKMGFLDRSGKVVVPARHVRVYAYSEGLARVELE